MKDQLERLEQAVDYIAQVCKTYGGGDIYQKVHEILNPANPSEFLECDTCRAKAGSPTLCKGCLHNRALIGKLKHHGKD